MKLGQLSLAVHGLLVTQQEAAAICSAHAQLSLRQPAWKAVDPLKGSIVCWVDVSRHALCVGQVLFTQVQQTLGKPSKPA
jgi:hypothetical protein